jgi:hypothetical protein
MFSDDKIYLEEVMYGEVSDKWKCFFSNGSNIRHQKV